jgi:predicted membrane GTPase involved in stress response
MLIHALAKEAAGNRLEVTPQSLRIRKFRLDENERKRAAKRMQEA